MTEQHPLVSMIVPCYNVAEYLRDTLESIRAQSLTDWECVIVDDGSTDDTAKVAKDYVLRDERFIYVYQENRGLAGARNTGIRNSRGKYIIPLDGDDLIAESYLSKASEILDGDPEVKVVYSFARFFGSRKGVWRLREYSYPKLLLGNQIFCSCMYRREDYERTGGYDENLRVYEDWDFLIRLLYGNGRVERIPEVMFFYRARQGSLTNSQDSSKRCLEARRYIFKKNIDIYYDYYDVNPQELCGIGNSRLHKILMTLSLPRRIWEFIVIGLKHRG